MKDTSMRRRLLNAVRQRMIPLLQSQEEAQMVLGEPPFFVPTTVTLDFHVGKPLSSAEGKHTYPSPGVVHYWPRLEVHSNRFCLHGICGERRHRLANWHHSPDGEKDT